MRIGIGVGSACAIVFVTCAMLTGGCRPAKTDTPSGTAVTVTPSAKGAVVAVEESAFAREVEQAEGVVVVDFWATWCAPCKAIAPTLEKLAGEYVGKVKVCKVDVDQNQALARRLKIRALPTVVMFVNGREKDHLAGVMSEKQYRAWFDKHLKQL